MACPSVSDSFSDSINPRALHIVEIGTLAEIKYFFNVYFLLGIVSK